MYQAYVHTEPGTEPHHGSFEVTPEEAASRERSLNEMRTASDVTRGIYYKARPISVGKSTTGGLS